MGKIVLPIDTKSLYFNIKNDNLAGHTATVATPLKQGRSYNYELGRILEIKEKELQFQFKPDLIRELIKNSKSKIKITNVFVFDKISVNGEEIDTSKQYCIFIKEEVDPTKAQFGRLKIHYPSNLKFSDVELDIDNKSVIRAISQYLKNYAFLVKGFEYDTNTRGLNFDTVIVGENGVPYSKVFINEKGVGNKFTKVFNDMAEDYDMEIISMREKFGVNVDVLNYSNYCQKLQKEAMNIVSETLKNDGAIKIDCISQKYPYSLYDIRYELDGVIKYAIVSWTATNVKYFNLSIKKNIYCHDFADYTDIYLVSDILGVKQLTKYSITEIDNLSKMINSIKFTDEGD